MEPNISLEVTNDELSLLMTALDHLVKAGGLNAAQKCLPLAAKLSEVGQRSAKESDQAKSS